ncbi:MAG: MGMT family protein [bacterium]|nr:MGMT family protein [bacterium]
MTKFQEKVYKVVSGIPKGKTLTYKEVAKLIGSPKAFRAVGTALNKNPFLGAVPCHRVVRSDGKAGGYVLGTKKKLELLKKELVQVLSSS